MRRLQYHHFKRQIGTTTCDHPLSDRMGKVMMDRTAWCVIAVVAFALIATGCSTIHNTIQELRAAGRTSGTAPETPSVGAEIGTSSGSIASAMVDPCTLNLENPVWRGHGGRVAYEKRCGHPPSP
jgi:hypothetical protein